jgi:hypothetical protein
MIMPRQPIYDDKARNDFRPQQNGETSFEFFNRAGGSLWRESRTLHQEWANRLGDREYAETRAALRSGGSQARSAFLELYLHECLVRGGHEVTIHPELSRTSNKPDFLAAQGPTRTYIEAIVPGRSKEETAKTNRIDVLLAALDRTGDDNFFLMTTSISPSQSNAPASAIRNQVRKWLATLNPDAVDPQSLPERTFEQAGWSITVEAIPISADNRGKVGRSIGIYAHYEAEIINSGPRIVTALESKAKKYGNLEAPFVVAIGLDSFDEDDHDVFDALYGSVSWSLEATGPGESISSRAVRNRNGYFGWPGSWKNRHVSGVLIVDQLLMHDPTRARVSLWIHPDAIYPLPSDPMFPGVVYSWNGKNVERAAGLDGRALLGLPEGWPGGKRWTR